MYCLYIITNRINNRKYIGITVDFQKRSKRHLRELRENRHHSIFLQRAFNKYGEENFDFEILFDDLSKDKAEWLEEFYLNEHYNNVYNVSKKSSGGDLISYHPELDKIKKKHSENGNAWWDSLTEEEKKAHGDKSRGENNGMYGRKHKEESKKKMSENSKGWSPSEETRKRMSLAQKKRYENNPEFKSFLSEVNKKRYENPEERQKTAEATKRAFDNNPAIGERISFKNRSRYKMDYTVSLPTGEEYKFTNLMDVNSFLSESFALGRWVIRKLIETGEPWIPTYERHKHLEGLTIIRKEIK